MYKIIDSKAKTYKEDDIWLMNIVNTIKFSDGEIVKQVIPKVNIMSGTFDCETSSYYVYNDIVPRTTLRCGETVTFRQLVNSNEPQQYVETIKKARKMLTLDDLVSKFK